MAFQPSPSSRTAPRSSQNVESGIQPQSSRVRAIGRPGLSVAQSSKPPARLKAGINATGPLRSGKVNTDLKSYDRRDPLIAIGTLLKLLTSLPSRVVPGGGGGCQYKLLAIDEHKLSMHLCNIIEPFILSFANHCDDNGFTSGGASSALFKRRIHLLCQPTETLDRIVSYIDNREELMNFGLTCKRLSDVVFPRHWEYRVIRAKVSMVGVWKHLCERSDLAVNVRVVEVVDERSDKRLLVPKVCRKAAAFQGKRSGTMGAGSGVKAEEVISATSTEDSSSASGSEVGENIVGAVVKKVSMHKRQEKYFTAALAKMTCLSKLKWEANHSPMSVLDEDGGTVWKTLAEKCGSLELLEIADNMSFSPLAMNEDEGEDSGNSSGPNKSPLINLRSISLRATQFSYGAPKNPSLNRIAAILHQCPNIENLEIMFRASKNGTTSLPVANEFLVCGRWSHLTSLTLTNLTCFTATVTSTPESSDVPSAVSIVQQNPLQTFLSAHPNLETLKIIDVGPTTHFRRLRTLLAPNTLPKLRELHASKDIVNMILKANCDVPRPLEVIKGFKLTGASEFVMNAAEKTGELGGVNLSANYEFYRNLKKAGASVKRIEMEGWGDLDDVKMLALCVPKLTWLDVGRRLRASPSHTSHVGLSATGVGNGSGGSGRAQSQAPVTNMVEWADVLSGFEELTTFHGVKFFYEVSPNALPNGGILLTNESSTGPSLPVAHAPLTISMTDRSRIKKNDEISSVLAWKCPKLRRVDHWESVGGPGGKIIVLHRDSDFGLAGGEGNLNKVRWDVRRVRG